MNRNSYRLQTQVFSKLWIMAEGARESRRSRLFSPASACPYPNDAVLAALGKIPILESYPFNRSWDKAVGFRRDSGTAVPVPTVGLVVDLGYIFTGGGGDSPSVEHHACDWTVVRVRIVYGSCSKIPYLKKGIQLA